MKDWKRTFRFGSTNRALATYTVSRDECKFWQYFDFATIADKRIHTISKAHEHFCHVVKSKKAVRNGRMNRILLKCGIRLVACVVYVSCIYSSYFHILRGQQKCKKETKENKKEIDATPWSSAYFQTAH
jgi:hypothetical protein